MVGPGRTGDVDRRRNKLRWRPGKGLEVPAGWGGGGWGLPGELWERGWDKTMLPCHKGRRSLKKLQSVDSRVVTQA